MTSSIILLDTVTTPLLYVLIVQSYLCIRKCRKYYASQIVINRCYQTKAPVFYKDKSAKPPIWVYILKNLQFHYLVYDT